MIVNSQIQGGVVAEISVTAVVGGMIAVNRVVDLPHAARIETVTHAAGVLPGSVVDLPRAKCHGLRAWNLGWGHQVRPGLRRVALRMVEAAPSMVVVRSTAEAANRAVSGATSIGRSVLRSLLMFAFFLTRNAFRR